MNWTMPPGVLRIVAGALIAISLGAFAMGVIRAPERGRLPGEREEGGASSTPAAAAAAAPEAQPLSQERIEGPPPAPELTPEEKAQAEADKTAKAQADAAAKTAVAQPQVPPPPPTPTPTLQVPEPQPTAPADEAPH
jgi:hypothetical protein